MKQILSFLTVFVLFVIIALPTRSIQAYKPAQSLEITNPATLPVQTPALKPAESQTSDGSIASLLSTCHFGISVINNWNDVDLSTLGVGNYLDWGRDRDIAVVKNVAANIDYYRVLNLFDKNYAALKLELPGLIAKGYGASWIIGNEPDSEVTYQNHISAETYGQRYFELANIIRQNDPTAKIGFGAIMQVTPIRLYYLDLALNQLAQLAGGVAQAHALIDFYAIHAYILNETQLYDPDTGKNVGWGTGVPVGYDPATWPAPEAIHTEWGETYKIYDIDIFKARLIDFRQWMIDHGEKDKPLWVTEFGVLFPSSGNPYLYVSDEDTANFMTEAFDFMLGYKDPQLGYAADDNRLVQKWTWFSLNYVTTQYGGSFFDPDTHQITRVGQRFIQYDPSLDAVPVENTDAYIVPGSLTLTGISDAIPSDQVYYKVNVKIGNNVSSDRHTGITVNLYDGETLIGSTPADMPRCGGTDQVSFLVKGLRPDESHNFTAQVNLRPGSGSDTNLGNNRFSFGSILLPESTSSLSPVAYLPVVLK